MLDVLSSCNFCEEQCNHAFAASINVIVDVSQQQVFCIDHKPLFVPWGPLSLSHESLVVHTLRGRLSLSQILMGPLQSIDTSLEL